ncbi:MAG TPA: signal peptidase II [Polyangia bacterium]|nr:signal peptidase II [Polyangia bacterium]
MQGARKYVLFGLVTAAVLAVDQVSKVWARSALRPIYPNAKSVIPGLWEFRYSENTGSAFGMFRNLPGGRYLLVAVGLIALGFIVNYLRKQEASRPMTATALALIAGGAVGNVFDRVAFGKVTDFILWRYQHHEWPVFNFADAALVAGVLALLLFGPRKPKKQAQRQARSA